MLRVSYCRDVTRRKCFRTLQQAIEYDEQGVLMGDPYKLVYDDKEDRIWVESIDHSNGT
ncbi:MAG: hypothetical protein FWG40_01050 [Peptococcaceae bacterium]|nr:hypothetical protein [Peptococcaceae bacterium]